MTEDDRPLVDKVEAWLEKAGVALELRVTRSLAASRLCTSVEPSRPYFDRLTEKWREIDVVGHFANDSGSRRLQVVVECKSGKGRPWAVLTDNIGRPALPIDAPRRVLRSSDGITPDGLTKCWERVRGTRVLPTQAPGYAIVEVLWKEKDDKSQDDTGPRVPYKAVQQALSAARALHNQSLRTGKSEGHYVQFTVPVVVTAAPLFECSLSSEGALSVIPVQATTVEVQPDSGRSHPLFVHVMSEGELDTNFRGALEETVRLM